MDPVAEWSAAFDRVVALVSPVTAEQAARPVPACPDWTVRELLSHMVGLDVDVVRGDEPDDHNSAWTQRQVDERADRSVADLVSEWQRAAEPLRAWMRANNPRPLGDVIIHEQDLRGALGVPGGQDTDGLHAIRENMLGRFAPRLEGLAPLAFVADGWQWCSAGAADDAPVVLAAGAFDLSRAVISRRSAHQLRRWTVRGDIEPYLPAFEVLGPLPEHDLQE